MADSQKKVKIITGKSLNISDFSLTVIINIYVKTHGTTWFLFKCHVVFLELTGDMKLFNDKNS